MANEKNTTDVKLVTNCDRLQSLKHSSVKPYVFTINLKIGK